ncbi:MAG TPA: UTP--glucose-1-phosphate uridylyltransferase [Bdellovibrionota bacterium]|nr:UTP--glucose-1-phosphate uridylyltransferase [Bdellovibrionota bacterium]
MNTDQLNGLMKAALGTDSAALAAKKAAQELLRLDDTNWSYYFSLYQRHAAGSSVEAVPIEIYESGRDTEGKAIAYPISLAPAEMLEHLRMVHYADLEKRSDEYASYSRKAALWIKKMQAGSGSSLTRTSYLAARSGIPEAQVKIGSKGTDLFVDLPGGESIAIAEAQILQSILDQKRGTFGRIIFHDILSTETRDSIHGLWRHLSLIDRTKSYDELVRTTTGLARFHETMQAFVPTLDEAGKITFDRVAPGGHALFAVEALRAAYKPQLRPEVPEVDGSTPLISAISNGEDISGTPDHLMVGWMIREQVPIALVSTEKTAVDLKAGLVSLLRSPGGDVSMAVTETVQAEAAGQGALFRQLAGSINTNLALFNYQVLVPKIEKLVAEIGEDEFMKIIAPDLILNWKEQNGRKYLQLEGAMASTLMNLDRYWRKRYRQPLVHLIDVDRVQRTRFFSPIKSAFDFFMQFHSDRFSFDASTMRLRNLRPGKLPTISLKDPATKDKYYQDVKTVLDVFENARIADLDSLSIEGKVKLKGAVLRGVVELKADGTLTQKR